MRTWVIAIGLCLFLFIIPLQCFVIGNDLGMGIQGAVFRYQVTPYGTSLIPITHEIGYITSGIYTGETALSGILWIMGTFVLVLTTILSLMYWTRLSRKTCVYILAGVAGSVILYLVSCICRYGLFFYGPSGTSLPVGILMLAVFALFLSTGSEFFQDLEIPR